MQYYPLEHLSTCQSHRDRYRGWVQHRVASRIDLNRDEQYPYCRRIGIRVMSQFPDTSLNSIVMLALAIVIASLVSVGLQTVFGNPSPQSAIQFGIGTIAFLLGFGVDGWPFYKSYRTAKS
jgi:hypothetical protein